jgi:hypothetical protein
MKRSLLKDIRKQNDEGVLRWGFPVVPDEKDGKASFIFVPPGFSFGCVEDRGCGSL